MATLFDNNNAATNRAMALNSLKAAGAGGLTDFELEEITGVKQTSIGKRGGELVQMGLVEAAKDMPRRKNDGGSPCMVWRVTEKGGAA